MGLEYPYKVFPLYTVQGVSVGIFNWLLLLCVFFLGGGFVVIFVVVVIGVPLLKQYFEANKRVQVDELT